MTDAIHPERLAYQADWPEAGRRWAAVWDRANTDRPLLWITGPNPTARKDWPPLPELKSNEDLYMDPEYVSQSLLRSLDTTYFAGEAFPVSPYLMGAWALGCGPDVTFAENTVWHPILMRSIGDPPSWKPGPDDPWRRELARVVERLLDLAPGQFLVGQVCQTMTNDLLALIRGTEDFLVELAIHPAACRARLLEMVPLWLADFEHFRRLIETRQPGTGCAWGWPGLWHPTGVMVSQSDMSCMISTEMFDQYVMAELDFIGERSPCVWYHLDGSGALHHLPRLLSLPYIRMIQYVPEYPDRPNGPLCLDLYRRIQAAGKGLDIYVPFEHMEFLIRHLRPEGLILRTWAPNVDAARELIDDAAKWSGSHAKEGV